MASTVPAFVAQRQPPPASPALSRRLRECGRSVRTRIDVRLVRVESPLVYVSRKVCLPPFAVAFWRFRAHVVRKATVQRLRRHAGLLTSRISEDCVVRVRAIHGRGIRRGRPRIDPLFASPTCRKVPLRLAWQKPAIPDAEGICLVPRHVVDRQVLIGTRGGRPRCACKAFRLRLAVQSD